MATDNHCDVHNNSNNLNKINGNTWINDIENTKRKVVKVVT